MRLAEPVKQACQSCQISRHDLKTQENAQTKPSPIGDSGMNVSMCEALVGF
jgi:hypothetical protein